MALLGVVGIQGWLLHQAKTPPDMASKMPVPTLAAEQSDTHIAPHIDASQLARIDARLSALESIGPAVPTPPQRDIVLGSPDALAADRNIAALLPSEPITPQALFLLQSQLAQSPSSDQAQLSAALARAINNGQVQIASKP